MDTTDHEVTDGPDLETSADSGLAPCWEDAARMQAAMVGMSFRR